MFYGKCKQGYVLGLYLHVPKLKRSNKENSWYLQTNFCFKKVQQSQYVHLFYFAGLIVYLLLY